MADIDLTILDSDCGAGRECTLKDAIVVARLLYGMSGSSLRVVHNEAGLIRLVQHQHALRKLVFMLEGADGEIAINQHYRALSVYAEAWQKKGPTVGQLIFDSCNVMKGATEVVALMKALRARIATGYAAFHIWRTMYIDVERGNTAADLEAGLNRALPGWNLLREYLMPGQQLPHLAAVPGRHTLYFEFFSRTTTFKDVPLSSVRSESQLRGIMSRARLTRKTYNVSEAESAAKELDVPAGPICLVTFQDPSAP